jgi:uncharacterized protein
VAGRYSFLPPNSQFFTSKTNRFSRFALLGLLLSLVAFLPGCKRNEEKRLTPAQIHQITRDLAAAASSAVPAGTPIQLRQGASVRQPEIADGLRIVLTNHPSTDSGRVALTKLFQSLETVITRNHLTRDSPVQAGDTVRFVLRHSGVPTHQIEIVTRGAAASGIESQGARLAIILDDLGSDRATADAIFSLHYPLTISVLPNHEHSSEIASEAHRRGYQVLLHLPMQSLAKEKPEARELHGGMPEAEVSALVDQFLQNVPDVAGVNNHQGSQATSDAALMAELMPVLRDRQLFYVDSRTTAATVAYDTAQSFGVPAAFRNVPFLDDVAEPAAVRKQLELALRGAREKGEAVAIGHPYRATLQALREVLPQAQPQGVRLVFASELVH